MSDEKIDHAAEARKAADKIHRWAFGDDSELADRSAVRFEVERITDALEAAQQAPAVDREALVKIIWDAHQSHYPFDKAVAEYGRDSQVFEEATAAVNAAIASGILLDAAEVEARGLEKAADEIELHRVTHITAEGIAVSALMEGASELASGWLRARAQQVREGNA